ncbi:MAPEG family protein [Qipengyuania nanhaisediminis]|uniref:MAPEG family protein n=1 Tax=Qipengyuania nanhaisediminis TaxID=604088 RepID=UPI0038B34DFC
MLLPITATTAALLALLLLALAIQTVCQRVRLKTGFGDGGDPSLIAASRSHGNLAEHAPIVLIMLGLLEYASANRTLLMVLAAAFVIGRICHVFGLHTASEPGKPPLLRQVGVILTWLVMLVLAVVILLGVFA